MNLKIEIWAFISIFCFSVFNAKGQSIPQLDTIVLPTIVVQEKVLGLENGIYFKNDSTDLTCNVFNSLSEYFVDRVPIYSKELIPGLSSSVSFRGNSSNQIKIFWNGFLSENSMLGGADLTLFNFNGQTKISVLTESLKSIASIASINIDDNPYRNDRKLIADLKISSIDNIKSGITYNLKSGKYLHSLSGEINSNHNNYYFTTNHSTEEITNANSYYYKLNYNFNLTKDKSSFSIFTSFNLDRKQIPPSIYESFSDAIQKDKNLKIGVKYSWLDSKILAGIRQGFFYDFLRYNNDKISDRSLSNIYSSETGLNICTIGSKKLAFEGDLTDRLLNVRSSKYNVNDENQAYSNFVLKINSGKLRINIGDNITYFDRELYVFYPSVSAELSINKGLFLEAKTGRLINLPTLNDRFWNSSLGSGILPEKIQYLELSMKYIGENNLSFSATPFYKYEIDKITWIPTGGIWEARNMDKVKSTGIDISTIKEYKIGLNKLKLLLIYNYNSSKSSGVLSSNLNKNIIYFPKHQLNLQQNYFSRRFNIFLSEHYRSRVYTTYDNEDFIESYILFDINIARKFIFNKTDLVLNFGISNIFGNKYELIKNYPMPDRVFSFTIKILN